MYALAKPGKRVSTSRGGRKIARPSDVSSPERRVVTLPRELKVTSSEPLSQVSSIFALRLSR